ncbi:MAG: hypothetical protein HY393_02705 [Candidatus Diapherotrites archaeon]|nr:hypothetical protein [Candidatus Diapherotrites archaeon]
MTEIKRFVLLVHPFFTLINDSQKDILKITPLDLIQRNSAFLLGRWGRAINQAAKRPDTFVIIVRPVPPKKYYPHTPPSPALLSLGVEKLGRLLGHAQRVLGNRLLMVNDAIDPYEPFLLNEIKSRGFSISPNWTAKSFGEYWNDCVNYQSDALKRKLPRSRTMARFHTIEKLPGLSLIQPTKYFSLFSNPLLGAMNVDLRKHVRKRRGTRRKK